MELISQHTKAIMEGCKARAKEAGLNFESESLEYIVTNRDLLELSPKGMIPTLYDYWVHDIEVLREMGKYELYPVNPYETVINTRPAISFYNDNNPDWLNVMIFYHVLGHIDFFQNNHFFKHTWDYDFTGQALSDKRMIAKLRSEKGRWVDYVIEFSRSVDNLVGYFDTLSKINQTHASRIQKKLDFYFDVFLQQIKKVNTHEYVKEIEKYNQIMKKYGEGGEDIFFSEISTKNPELETLLENHLKEKQTGKMDVMQYVLEKSPFLNKEENKWMKSVVEVVRNTSLFFQPQIRTKIMNEGWASYWHQKLFLSDDRIQGHEVDYARVNAYVTAMPRIGINPYALGMKLFEYIEDCADKGKYSFEFLKIKDAKKRKEYHAGAGNGNHKIFEVRKNLSDYLFISTFLDQDFVNLNKLFVAGKRLNQQRMVWEYYVKSRNVKDYRDMLFNSLYHPPHIAVDPEKTTENLLCLIHHFEGKPLYKEFIPNTMMGIEFLWGNPVNLETYELKAEEKKEGVPPKYQRVLYRMEHKKFSKKILYGYK